MYNFNNIDFMDFQFNGKWLSDFNGYVGSSDGGLKSYSVLPSRSYTVDKPLKSNITTVYASSLEPRPFEVPVVFDSLEDSKLRDIAMWLDSPIPSKFQWKGDNVYINAQLDSTDFNAQSTSGSDGQIALKFICYDPFYYSLNETQYIHTSSDFVSGQLYEGDNNGYGELDPILKISGSGTFKIEIFDSKEELYSETNITSVIAGVNINCETQECKLFSGANHFNNIDNFPIIPNGKFKYKITGTNITNVEIRFRVKYI